MLVIREGGKGQLSEMWLEKGKHNIEDEKKGKNSSSQVIYDTGMRILQRSHKNVQNY